VLKGDTHSLFIFYCLVKGDTHQSNLYIVGDATPNYPSITKFSEHSFIRK